ncbi:MAG: hypothetical protein WCJ84_06295 [Candidatus Peregrinibacteria bacterium]
MNSPKRISALPTEASQEQRENMQHSQVVLHLIRHGDKASAQPGQPDKEVPLKSPEGVAGAYNSAIASMLMVSTANFIGGAGSGFERADQSVRSVMAQKLGVSLAEIQEKSADEMHALLAGQTTKDGRFFQKRAFFQEFPELGLNADYETLAGAELLAGFKKGEYLRWVVNESDGVAKKHNDAEVNTYTRRAKDVANLLLQQMDRRFGALQHFLSFNSKCNRGNNRERT